MFSFFLVPVTEQSFAHDFDFPLWPEMPTLYDKFTLNSIYRAKAFIKNKHALQYQVHSLCSTILYLFLLMLYYYVVDIEVHVNYVLLCMETFFCTVSLGQKMKFKTLCE